VQSIKDRLSLPSNVPPSILLEFGTVRSLTYEEARNRPWQRSTEHSTLEGGMLSRIKPLFQEIRSQVY
jgi:hypothetical protein